MVKGSVQAHLSSERGYSSLGIPAFTHSAIAAARQPGDDGQPSSQGRSTGPNIPAVEHVNSR
jgi:hypothetical protein